MASSMASRVSRSMRAASSELWTAVLASAVAVERIDFALDAVHGGSQGFFYRWPRLCSQLHMPAAGIFIRV